MTTSIAERISKVTPALTLSISSQAMAMQKSGITVSNLSAGIPSVDTPEHIKEAAMTALKNGKTKYGDVNGEKALREVIVEKLYKDNNLHYKPENIVVSNGCKHALFNIFFALLEPGDEVIIPSPYWLSFPEMVRLAGGVPVFIQGDIENDNKFSAETLKNAITSRTKLLMFNSPSNPTGAVYSRTELTAIADIIVKSNIKVISDEIFEKIIYDGEEHISIASLNEEIFKRTIIANGFSKIYSMTGWRVGYFAASEEIVNAVVTSQSHMTSNVCSFAQYGGIAAYQDPRSQESVEEMKDFYLKGRRLMFDAIQSIPGLSCNKPSSTFYLFVNIRETGLSSTDFCKKLLASHHVAAVPGVCFGADDHVRFLFATEQDIISHGIEGLSKFMRSRFS